MRVGFVVTAGHEPGFIRGTAGIIERLDGTRFEPAVFCARRSVERLRKSLKRENLPVIPLPTRFDRAVKLVRESSCDIIYYWKVGSDTWNLFLPMAMLAPVQCTSWGTHGTSGVNAVDYYISSSLLETAAADVDTASHYTERLELITTLPTFQSRQVHHTPATRSDFGLPSHGSLYFCPHRLPKYHPDFDLYLRGILEQDSTGCLAILCGQQATAQAALQQRLTQSLGSRLCKRLHYVPAMPLDKYYRLLQMVTVILDSPAYAGGITAYDAFSFGIPVVTKPGELAVQNYTAALYRRMGIVGLVARNLQDYVSIATRLGTDADYRHDMSQQIIDAGRTIFDDPQVTPSLENFFLEAMRALDSSHRVA